MKNMIETVLDLETMGLSNDAAIIEIGAVAFNLDGSPLGYGVSDSFSTVITLDSSVAAGGVIDPSTVIWWMGQSAEARERFTARAAMPLEAALWGFSTWLKLHCEAGRGDVNVWGNGAGFDNVVLASAYKRAGIPLPWSYRNNRCYRTMAALYPHVELERVGIAHSGVDDARSQANHLVKIMKELK
jgi:exodeoxyribonuclease VIII